MSRFDDLSDLVLDWARARKIIPNSTATAQLLKSVSEMGELCDAQAKHDRDGVIDGIGDVLVTLVIYADLCQLNLTECLEAAYGEIKDRRGTLTEAGIFIKETAGS